MNKRNLILVVSVILLITAITGFNYYQKIYGKAVIKNGYIYIKSTDSFEDLSSELEPFLQNWDDFKWVANQKEFSNLKPGKYEVVKDMSHNDLVNLLRSGKQIPVMISFNNQNSLEKLAGRISKQIEADSLSLLNSFKDKDFLKKENYNEQTILGMFIPNSYEFYWSTSADEFRNRMLKEQNRFWNEQRMSKVKKLGFTKNEVLALASIVQKETAKPEERPIVAGLYINRLKRGIPLQADPTIVYILKQQNGPDFEVKRVLYKDLKIKSPYNTYINRGLPPSLIAMPDISSIDGVLNHQKHNYLYMCASVEKLGYHEFASSLSQHNRNARKYQKWLNNKGIRR